jgi:hypothetical protein
MISGYCIRLCTGFEMSSLKDVMQTVGNCGGAGKGKGNLRVEKGGRAVWHQPGTSVDKNSHHEIQRGISK